MSDNVKLRSNMVKVIDTYGTLLGAVPLQLLFYHVNNEDKFKDTGFSKEEILDELEYLEGVEEIEKTDAWIIKERKPRLKRR